MKYIYILKTGTTFESTKEKLGDFDRWVKNNIKEKNIKTVNIEKNEKLPGLKSAKGFIITGSHSMVTEELGWSRELERYIKEISSKKIPLLGICYGHQLISKALGGKADFNKKGKEIGSVKIKKLISSEKDPLLKDIPGKFYGHETHYQSALKLPSSAVVLAKNLHDRHQAVRFNDTTWGVQFHPEFDEDIMKEYIVKQEKSLEKLGFDKDKLLRGVKNCKISSRVLKNFEKIINS